MRRGRRQGRAAGSGLDPAPGRARRNSQAERLSLGNSRRSARLGSARLGSARLGSARLGSARLGSARLIIAVSKCSLDVKSFFDICSKSPDHAWQRTRDAVRHGSNELDPSPARSLHIRANPGRRGHRQLIPAHPPPCRAHSPSRSHRQRGSSPCSSRPCRCPALSFPCNRLGCRSGTRRPAARLAAARTAPHSQHSRAQSGGNFRNLLNRFTSS